MNYYALFLEAENVSSMTSKMTEATGGIFTFLGAVVNVLLSLFCSAMGILAIVHAFTYAKSDDAQQKQVAKNKINNLLIAFAMAFVLILLFNNLRDPMIDFFASQAVNASNSSGIVK